MFPGRRRQAAAIIAIDILAVDFADYDEAARDLAPRPSASKITDGPDVESKPPPPQPRDELGRIARQHNERIHAGPKKPGLDLNASPSMNLARRRNV